MLTERAMQHYRKRCRETLDKGLSPYDGHDTVGVIALDKKGSMSVATSTSGLFMKKRGGLATRQLSALASTATVRLARLPPPAWAKIS